MTTPNLTKTETNALKWLRQRNGDGVFDKHHVLLAAGETAHFMRSTWNSLRDKGMIEYYGEKNKRVRIVGAAQ